MVVNIKYKIKHYSPSLFYFLKKVRTQFLDYYYYYMWLLNNRPVPPPHSVKKKYIKDYSKRYQCTTLIETGTHFGDMIHANLNNFEHIISIELDEKLYSNAVTKFKNNQHVKILHGDSSELMGDIVSSIESNTLFWLDGHYSGPGTAMGDKSTPIIAELEHLFNSHIKNKMVILIDDAREFNGNNDYPTIDELKNYVLSKNEQIDFVVSDDIIQFCL